jgi:O-antigen/teichoic acid export membrane protein
MQLYQRLMAKGNFRSVLVVGSAWIVQFACSVLTSIILARYLGPAEFGVLSYVLAVMGFAATVAGFGLSNVVTRELVMAARPAGEVLGTVIYVRALMGGLALLGVLASVYFIEADAVAASLTLVALGTLLIDGGLVFECGLQAQRAFGSSGRAKAFLAVTSLAMRGGLVLLGAGLVSFIAVQYLEILLYIAVFGWIARQYLGGIKARWNRGLALEYLRQGFPIMLAGLATALYLRIDQIMIEHMLGAESLGVYSVGVRLASVASFFPGIVAYVLFPAIVEAQKVSPEKAEAEAIKLYRLMYATGMGFSVFMTLAGAWLTRIMFGAAYDAAVPVLHIYVWTTVFVFLTIASQAQLLSSAKTTHVVAVRTVAGAVTNIVLNLILIPRAGLAGAAWAAVISYGVAVFFFFDRKYSWPPVRSMLRALALPV